MTRSIEELTAQDAFLRSRAYDGAWMLEHGMGPSAVWLTEALCEHMAIKPGGPFGIVVPGRTEPSPDPVPKQPLPMWDPKECLSFHTDGWRHWADFERAKELADASRFDDELTVVEADGGRHISFTRLVAEVTDHAHG